MFSKDLPSQILFNMSHTKTYKEIPGPSLLSFVRNVRHNPVLYCYDLMQQYGDVVRCRSIRDIYLVSNPVLANKIFMNSQKLFDKKNFINKRLGEVMGEGLVVSTGAKWKKQRKAAEVIYKKEYLQELTPAILHYTDQMIEAWKLKAANKR
jgi:cytochrome P450